MAKSNGYNPETCAVCREAKPLGNCDFGKGNPSLIGMPHCLGCCATPAQDNWRPLSEVEGASEPGESSVRRILGRYRAAYANVVARITMLGCAQAIRSPRTTPG